MGVWAKVDDPGGLGGRAACVCGVHSITIEASRPDHFAHFASTIPPAYFHYDTRWSWMLKNQFELVHFFTHFGTQTLIIS